MHILGLLTLKLTATEVQRTVGHEISMQIIKEPDSLSKLVQMHI